MSRSGINAQTQSGGQQLQMPPIPNRISSSSRNLTSSSGTMVGSFGSITLLENNLGLNIGASTAGSPSNITTSTAMLAMSGKSTLEKALTSLKNLDGSPVRSKKMNLAPRRKSFHYKSGSVLGQRTFSAGSLPPQIVAILNEGVESEDNLLYGTKWLSPDDKKTIMAKSSRLNSAFKRRSSANIRASLHKSSSRSSIISTAIEESVRKMSRKSSARDRIEPGSDKSTALPFFSCSTFSSSELLQGLKGNNFSSGSFITQDKSSLSIDSPTTSSFSPFIERKPKNCPKSTSINNSLNVSEGSEFFNVTGNSFLTATDPDSLSKMILKKDVPFMETPRNCFLEDSSKTNPSNLKELERQYPFSGNLSEKNFNSQELMETLTADKEKLNPASNNDQDGGEEYTFTETNINDEDDISLITEELSIHEKHITKSSKKSSDSSIIINGNSPKKKPAGGKKHSGKRAVSVNSDLCKTPADRKGYYQISNYCSLSSTYGGVRGSGKGNSSFVQESPSNPSSIVTPTLSSPAIISGAPVVPIPPTTHSSMPNIFIRKTMGYSSSTTYGPSTGVGSIRTENFSSRKLLDPLWNEVLYSYDTYSDWSVVPRDPLVIFHAYKSKPPCVYSYVSNSISVTKTNGTANNNSSIVAPIDPINRHFKESKEVPESFFVNLGAFIVLDNGWNRLDAGRCYRTVEEKKILHEQDCGDTQTTSFTMEIPVSHMSSLIPIKPLKFSSYNKWSQKTLWNIRRVKNWWPWISDKTCAVLEKRQWRGPGSKSTINPNSPNSNSRGLGSGKHSSSMSSSHYSSVASSGYGSSKKSSLSYLTGSRLEKRLNRLSLKKPLAGQSGEEEEDSDLPHTNDELGKKDQSSQELNKPDLDSISSTNVAIAKSINLSIGEKGDGIKPTGQIKTLPSKTELENNLVSLPDIDGNSKSSSEATSWADNLVQEYTTELMKNTMISSGSSKEETPSERQQLIPRKAILASSFVCDWIGDSSDFGNFPSAISANNSINSQILAAASNPNSMNNNAPPSTSSNSCGAINNSLSGNFNGNKTNEVSSNFGGNGSSDGIVIPAPTLKTVQVPLESLPPLHVSYQPNSVMMRKAITDVRLKRHQVTRQNHGNKNPVVITKASTATSSSSPEAALEDQHYISLNSSGSLTILKRGMIGITGSSLQSGKS